jgi:hypothetical protein
MALPRVSHILLGSLTVASLGLVATVWHQQTEIRRLSALLERSAAGTARSAMANQPIGSAASTLTRTTTRAVPRVAARDTNAPQRDDEFVPSKLPAASAQHKPSGLAKLMADPEFVRAFAVHQEGALDTRFAALFRQLKLSDEELAAFKRLLAEKESVALDVVAISQESPNGPLPVNELRASISAARSQVENAIQASLGSERYAVYREFEQTLAQRAVVTRLEQRLSYTANPLQPGQADALVRVLARDTPAESDAARPAIAVLPTSGLMEGPAIVHAGSAARSIPDDAIAQAQAVLSPPQLAALRQIQGEMSATSTAARMFNTLAPPSVEADDELLPSLRVLLQ